MPSFFVDNGCYMHLQVEKAKNMRKKVDLSGSNDHMPEDILVQIFYKVPAKSLIRFSCASKLWFSTFINNHQQFNKFHYVESQKNPILMFTFEKSYKKKLYYLEMQGDSADNDLLEYRKTETLDSTQYYYGNYDGLACYGNQESNYAGEWAYFSLVICNHSRLEKLVIISRIQSKRWDLLIYGFRFGYDLLSNEYKVMCIIRSEDEYEYYVYSLGSTKPWRQIHNPWPKQRPINYLLSSRSVPPISCRGYNFYEMVKDEEEEEKYKCFSLVSFDLHGEKFQTINFPGDDEFILSYNNSILHPLEYKGCLCYSSMEKIDLYEGKVVLHILEDALNSVWAKETIKFDLPIGLDNNAGIGILSFYNQVILYWRLYNKRSCVTEMFNVHSEELNQVEHPLMQFGNDEVRKLSSISRSTDYDYYISSHVENFISLRTLATTGDENLTETLKDYRKNWHLDLFDHIPTSNPGVISFLDPW